MDESEIFYNMEFKDEETANKWNKDNDTDHMRVCLDCYRHSQSYGLIKLGTRAPVLAKPGRAYAQPLQPYEAIRAQKVTSEDVANVLVTPTAYSTKVLKEVERRRTPQTFRAYVPLKERTSMIYDHAVYESYSYEERRGHWENMADLALDTADKKLFEVATKHIQHIRYRQGELAQ
jgi:hypothetical protein